MPSRTDHVVTWQIAPVLLVGVYAAGVGAVALAPGGDPVAAWWPAAGIAVALLALAPARLAPVLAAGVLIAGALANLTGGRPLEVSLLFGTANAAEAVVGAAMLRRGGRARPVLETFDDFVRLGVAAVLGGVVAATGAAATVAVVQDGSFVTAWRSVMTTHAAATLVLVPVALVVGGQRVRRPTELVFQVAALCAVTLAVFSPSQSLPLTFTPLPFLAWAAVRFDLPTMAWELAGFAVATTTLTTLGYGPFNNGAAETSTVGSLAQGYLLAAALMSLPLAITVHQRRTLVERVSADERLFRRNFTESLVGMLFLRGDRASTPTGSSVGPGLRLSIIDLNDTATSIFGGRREELLGVPFADLLDTDEDLSLVAARMLAGELEGWYAPVALTGGQGQVRVALSLLSRGPDDPIFSAQLLDVTAEHDARRRLEDAEELTSATLDTTACVILVTDLEGTIVRANAATGQITGYAEKDLVGRKVWDTSIAPSDAVDVEALFMWPNRSGVPVVRERDAITADGEKLRIVWQNNIVRDEDGAARYAVMTGVDVTAERTTAGLMNHLMQASFTTALVGVDTAGRITVFNSGAQHLLGYEAEEVVGQPFHRLLERSELVERTGAMDPEDAFDVLIEEIGYDGESEARDWTWVSRSGLRHIVSMTLSVAQDAFASQVGFLIVGRDVTEQRQGQEMLVAALDKERTAVERLRVLDQAKDEFVSTVSHELRTPVTSILGYTEILQDGSIVDPHPEQLPLLDTILRNSQRLITVCNDLLLLSGLDAGNVQWKQESVDLTASLRPIEDSIRPLIGSRDIELSVTGPGRPVWVDGDRAQLERVMINLLSNAVKFSEDAGRVCCTLRIEGRDAVFEVIDDGIGIPLEEQKGLFQKFFRSSSAQQLAIQGTGLGLSIVAAIVEAHHGQIDVVSGHMTGSTFTVRLPLSLGG